MSKFLLTKFGHNRSKLKFDLTFDPGCARPYVGSVGSPEKHKLPRIKVNQHTFVRVGPIISEKIGGQTDKYKQICR